MDRTTWLPDGSERSVREALAAVAPDLGLDQLVLTRKATQPDPRYWSGTAIVDDRFVAKFAWAEAPAVRIWREGVLLERLAAADPGLPIPPLVRTSRQPAVTITGFVEGDPMTWEWASERSAADAEHLGAEIGTFLARLHDLPAERLLADLPPFTPTPQADTPRLRSRYPRLVDARRAGLVLRWCDWVDDALHDRPGTPGVLVHGDLHGFNQLWDHSSLQLRCAVDFEEAGVAEPEYDFRYLPGNSRSADLTLAAVAAYERRAGRSPDLRRILAWNVRTHLGDALWRTEARVPLPGGGDASSWVDDLALRLDDYGISP